MLAVDGGGLSASAQVTINVIRNTAPRITNAPTNLTLNNSQSVNTPVFTVQALDQDTYVSICKKSWFLFYYVIYYF